MSKRTEALNTLLQCRLANRIENKVDSLSVSQFLRFLSKISLRIVDNGICSVLLHQVNLTVTRHCADHPRTRSLGDLHRDNSDTTSRRVDKHGLPRRGLMRGM